MVDRDRLLIVVFADADALFKDLVRVLEETRISSSRLSGPTSWANISEASSLHGKQVVLSRVHRH